MRRDYSAVGAGDMLNFERLKDYTYIEHDEERSFDKHAKLVKTERQTYEVLILAATTTKG